MNRGMLQSSKAPNHYDLRSLLDSIFVSDMAAEGTILSKSSPMKE